MPIKVSHSLLKKVEDGYIDEAIAIYQGKTLPKTPQMELGNKWHRVWQNETDQTKRLPKEFGSLPLGEFKTEYKLRRDFKLGEYDIVLTGVMDLYQPDTKIARDYKCGKTSIAGHLSSAQHAVYSILAPFDTFFYHSYNPYTKEVKTAWVHITDKERQRGLDWVETWTSEFIAQLNYVGVV